MTISVWLAAAGIVLFVAACAAFFFVGRRFGRAAESARQSESKAGAEQTARRILDEAAREAESLRKTSVLSGKEELIQLREEWEQEARKRREEVEREERRVQERDSLLNRKYDLLEQREKDGEVDQQGLFFAGRKRRKQFTVLFKTHATKSINTDEIIHRCQGFLASNDS